MHRWEFVHAPSNGRDHWRWRQKDRSDTILGESLPFPLFLTCLSNAREHGFQVASHDFRIVKEAHGSSTQYG